MNGYGLDWNQVTNDKDQIQAVVKTLLNFQAPQNLKEFFVS
jgi:hypothetical protein